MRHFAVIALTAAYLVICALGEEEEKYSNKYDHLDVDAVLANDRLRSQYYNCFLDTGPCVTAEAIFFKEIFPEVIVTKCRKCNEKQKEAFEKIVLWFHENDPVSWEKAMKKGLEFLQKKAEAKKNNSS